MALLAKEEIKTLVEQPQGPCVSVFLPTHTAGAEIQQDPIRFKNLMKEAEEKLVEQGMRPAEAVEMLKRAYDLDKANFWRHQSNGLAVFVAKNFLRTYRLPLEFEEIVVVSDRFHVKPLMPLLTGDGRFYILALNQKQVRFLEGTRNHIKEYDLNSLEDVPESLREAVLQYEDSENQTQFETVGSASPSSPPGSSPGTFHGSGADEDKQIKILQFFNQVDAGLREFFQGDDAPMVLVGVDELLAIYKDANSYPHLLEEAVAREPKLIKPEELHEQAWMVVSPHFQQARKDAAERYREFSGNSPELASHDIREIVKAAYYQRVDTLFVAINHYQWGQFELQENAVHLYDSEEADSEDLLDFAALHTLLNGGTVFAVEPDQVPSQASVAAIFRFPGE
ncbi:MAG: hypothetical protein ACFB4I_03170 [Cyanophyceae cyanobacterium]